MSHYSKYDVTASFLGKTFTVRGVTAFNEDNARKQVKDLIKFVKTEKKKTDMDIPDFFKDMFGL